jgi:hypothetical protein
VIWALAQDIWHTRASSPDFLNFDIAFLPVKAQHLLDLAQKVETRRTQWLRNQVPVESFWQQ